MELLTSIEHTLGDVQSRDDQSDDGEPATDVKTHVQRNENNVFISEGASVLKDMDAGLTHLKNTYAGDAAVEQRILTLQRTIQGRLQSIEELAHRFKIPLLVQKTQDVL